MIIWPAKTYRANWTTHSMPGWVYACSDTGFTYSYISLQWVKLVFDPQTKQPANIKPQMFIWDDFGTHKTLEIFELCFKNNIILCWLLSHTSHKLQPCDVGVFELLETAYCKQVERMEQGGVNTVGKQHFTYMYSPARVSLLTKRNIIAAWRGSGLFPFNSERVLVHVLKPSTKLRILNANELRFESCPGYKALRTPTTPVSGKALTLLLERVKSVPNDDASSQHKGRLQQKVANAAQTYLAKIALLDDQNTFLAKINDKGKACQSADLKILETARVVRYENQEKAQAEHAIKDAKKAEVQARKAAKEAGKVASALLEAAGATVGKSIWGQKRKSTALGTEPAEPAAKVAQISKTQVAEVEQEGDAGEPRDKVACTSNGRVEEDWSMPKP
jgi:hypothetical protein